jgi:hypothetical protein
MEQRTGVKPNLQATMGANSHVGNAPAAPEAGRYADVTRCRCADSRRRMHS